ncbi:MAG: hypothetical protein ACKPGC_10180 [Planktothrix sp.]|uniref:hypothetical protein n=2 Tax=Planktothrix sp. TaxID=3088171 RepID=UPI0038D41C56
MFVKILNILNEIADKIKRDYPGSGHDHFFIAIHIWCKKLKLEDNDTKYIKDMYCQPEVNELINYLEEEWKWLREWHLFKIRSKFYNLKVWEPLKDNNENIKFKVAIAFAITAICYCIYKLDKPDEEQQITRREETIKSSNDLSFTVQNPSDKTLPPSPNPTITKQFLVLVVSHAEAGFLESLQAKRRIDFKDGESLYEITKYLWVGAEDKYSKIEANISDYSVAKGAESEYDIYLVSIELNQADEGFNSNVNQLDRYDAFRKLADLAVNFKISPRLRIEAYENIGVYNR